MIEKPLTRVEQVALRIFSSQLGGNDLRLVSPERRDDMMSRSFDWAYLFMDAAKKYDRVY